MSSQTLDVNFTSKSLFIRAGAGAGKTTQLINSFSEFVETFYEAHKRYPKIVITTFTRKATQEVKERLLVNALKKEDRGVFEYINKKSSVHISTIHVLLSLFLTQNAEALSLPQDLKIVDQSKSDRILKKAIHGLMKKNGNYIELLEAYPFYRLVDICREALNLRYQNAQLNYVGTEHLKNLTADKVELVLEKLKSVFYMVPVAPQKWQEYFTFLKAYQEILETNRIEDAILLFEDVPKKPSFLSKSPPFDVSAHDLIEEVRKEDLFLIQDTVAYRVQHEKLNRLFFDFLNDLFETDLQNKRRTGELTISDLENYALMLIHDFPELASEFSNSWDFFMIDEYQDTSPLQVKILNRIVADKPCFIVGDPQQSIYLFRGARSEVFDEKELELKQKNIETRVLNTNYRSDPSLMSFMNEFFKPFKQSFKPMQLKDSVSTSKLKEQVFYVHTHDQVIATLKHIQNLLDEGVAPQDICVISRKNSNLLEIARKAYGLHIPVQLQAAGGFEMKREILDLVAFLKFLVNPYDSENLILLLRSPWLFLEDQVMVDLAHNKDSTFSFWSALLHSNEDVFIVLRTYLDDFENQGASLTLRKFILESGFLAFSELLDPTGKREANIWKFVMALASAEKQNGFSLSLFIEDQFQSLQSDLGSSSGEAQPVIQPERVSLMTVHASKGLEFKHVIVIGVTDRPQQSLVLNMAFDPKAALFSLAVYNEQESKLLPSAWSIKVRKEFNQRELLEHERVLYVAMTRAQESVSLIAELPRPGERNTIVSESWYRKILWPEESGQVDSYSVRSVFYDDLITARSKNDEVQLQVREKKYANTATTVGHHSVTEILTDANLSNLTTAEPQRNLEQNIKALKKAQKGTDLHRVFESLKYLSIEELQSELTSDEQKMVQYLLQQKEIDLNAVLELGHSEWGFGLQLQTQVLQGQIDAWAELPKEIHVLDFKTGSQQFSEKAFEQLALYTFALLRMKKISPNKQIVHSVIYPVDQKIVKRQYTDARDFSDKQPATLRELFI